MELRMTINLQCRAGCDWILKRQTKVGFAISKKLECHHNLGLHGNQVVLAKKTRNDQKCFHFCPWRCTPPVIRESSKRFKVELLCSSWQRGIHLILARKSAPLRPATTEFAAQRPYKGILRNIYFDIFWLTQRCYVHDLIKVKSGWCAADNGKWRISR